MVTPASFAREVPPERITGFEAEDDVRRARTGGVNWADLERLLTSETFAQAGLVAQVLPYTRNPSDNEAWLANGGRLYVDRNPRDIRDLRNLEYCTPEVPGPRRATIALRASRVVLHKLVQATGLPLRILRRGAYTNKLGQTVTSGLQTNLIAPERIVTPPNIAILETHWATALYTWAGMVGATGYRLSQKGQGIGRGIAREKRGLSTEGNKPLGLILPAHEDDDVNGGAKGFTRVEDRTKEESTDWGTFMNAATTSVLLRVLEHPKFTDLNKRLRQLIVADPVETLHITGSDLTLQCIHPLRDGRELRAIDIQAELAAVALELSERITLPADEQWAVKEWVRVCQDLQIVARTENIELVDDRIGWAARLSCLRLEGYDENTTVADHQAANFCLSWDRVSPAGARPIFERHRGVAVVDENEVAQAVHTPPAGARAPLRAEHIQNRRFIIDKIGWNFATGIKLDAEGNGTEMHCHFHPYTTTHTCTPRQKPEDDTLSGTPFGGTLS